MSNTLAEQAYHLAAQGIPVFPCNANKVPCTPHGYKDAISDPERARSLFRSYPNAALISIPTGVWSDIVAVDIDPDAIRWFRQCIERFTETRIDLTPRGGYHLLYRPPSPAVKNSASKIAKGFDVRGEGGSLIIPPSLGYTTIHDVPIAPFPKWLARWLNRKPKPVENNSNEPNSGNLDALVRFATLSGVGERNVRCFWAAAKAGRMVRAGKVALSDARNALIQAAMQTGLDAAEAQTVTMSGLRRGQQEM